MPVTIQEAQQHLVDSTAFIADRYRRGTDRANWESAAASEQAKANYSAGVQEAISKGKREAGIRKAGDAAYKAGCANKGAGVIAQRIADSASKYGSNFAPVLSAMQNAAAQAKPRTRDFQANITNRLIPVVQAAKAAAKT